MFSVSDFPLNSFCTRQFLFHCIFNCNHSIIVLSLYRFGLHANVTFCFLWQKLKIKNKQTNQFCTRHEIGCCTFSNWQYVFCVYTLNTVGATGCTIDAIRLNDKTKKWNYLCGVYRHRHQCRQPIFINMWLRLAQDNYLNRFHRVRWTHLIFVF